MLFHTYDEPHDVSWQCLRDGCTADDVPEGQSRFGTYQTAGNQAMVDAIRAIGAKQPIVISGPDFDGDLSQWVRTRLTIRVTSLSRTSPLLTTPTISCPTWPPCVHSPGGTP